MDCDNDRNDNPPQIESNQDTLSELFTNLNIHKAKSSDFSADFELNQLNLPNEDLIKCAISLIQAEDSTSHIKAAHIIRNLTCKETDPPFQQIMSSWIIPHLIQLIPNYDETFALEIAWILSNLASGNEICIQYVLSIRSIELFNWLIKKAGIRLFTQIMWAIGNIAAESARYRNLILNEIDMKTVVGYLNGLDESQISFTLVWSVSNLIKIQPIPHDHEIKPFIPFITRALLYSEDTETLMNALWSLWYLTNENSSPKYFPDPLIIKIISLINSPEVCLAFPSLKVFGNYCVTDANINLLINSGILMSLYQIIYETQLKCLKKEIYWILYNLFVESDEIIEEALKCGFFELMRLTLENESLVVKKEGIYALCNAASACNPLQSKRILDLGIGEILIEELGKDEETDEFILHAMTDYIEDEYRLDIIHIDNYLGKLNTVKRQVDEELYEKLISKLEMIRINALITNYVN
ncbi:unnamed protein product [Blepharisma stoltei]|uniref:Importin subunit alpha n=1 Tax=Blepharisma stoltei TaxID=1481888 RepID=A0AAU9K9I7_9CILI|nr:unnamed protein product [Blepharisma stoltei]